MMNANPTLQNTSLKRYAAYKDSGVEWLPKIPSHWNFKKVKHLFKIGRGRVISQEELKVNGKYPVFSSQTKNDGCLGFINSYDFDCKQITWTTDGANAGTVFLRTGKHNCTNVCGTLQPYSSDISTEFYSYCLQYVTRFYKRPDTNGAKIMNGEMAQISIMSPPLEEQNRIVNFLDQKTVAIDTAIAKKQRLIELLKEQKAILINRAVTRGLNPGVPMKDSGVEWIGEIPTHWDVIRAKFLFNEVDERSETGQEELLSVSHLTGVTPRSEKNVSMFMAEDYSGSKLCKPDDLIINIMWAWMGALGISYQTGIISPSYGVYRQKKKIFNSWFLEHLLRSGQYVAEYNRRSTGLHSSRLRLYSHMFFDMELAFPSLEEQNQIELITTQKLTKISQTLYATEKQIAKLNEYKQTLIAHTVTGKIKVPS